MIAQLTALLRACREIDGFKLIDEVTDSEEFFLVKQELDLYRTKTVRKIQMTLYKECEVSGVKYQGAASASIHPTMNQAELKKVIAETAFAASLVKNPYYPLVKPVPTPPTGQTGPLKPSAETVLETGPDLIKALLDTDRNLDGWLNSAELFITKVQKRIINSAGVDYSGEQVRSYLELIATWPGTHEEAELYRELQFAVFTPEMLREETRKLLLLCREKANARPTPTLRKHTVLLTGEPVRDYLNYYYEQTAAKNVYEGTSTLQSGQPAHGDISRGDRLSLVLEPQLANSRDALNFDSDGTLLRPVEIIKDGIVSNYWGEQQYAYYLGIPATGIITNAVFRGGSRTVAQLKEEPYLEVLAFSDFQVNPVTGDFGGEIRLGRYFDGYEVVPVTGGSVSGNILAVQEELFCSQEQQTAANFRGPLTIRLTGVAVAGCHAAL